MMIVPEGTIMDNDFAEWWQKQGTVSPAELAESAFAAGRAAERDKMAKANSLIDRNLRRLARHSVAAEHTITVLQRQMEAALEILAAEGLVERTIWQRRRAAAKHKEDGQ